MPYARTSSSVNVKTEPPDLQFRKDYISLTNLHIYPISYCCFWYEICLSKNIFRVKLNFRHFVGISKPTCWLRSIIMSTPIWCKVCY